MKMKKNKIRVISAVVSAIMLASSASAFAKFDAYNDSDGFTLGHYEVEVNQEQRSETEKLYEQRPKNERQFENLSRGLVAVPGENGTLVSWRFLGTDSNSLTYNLYCSGEKLNDKPITTTNFFHTGASTNAEYTLKEVENGEETGVEYTTTAWDKNYIGFKVTEREGYNIDDGAVADLDGDGEYEYIVKWDPSNSKDNSVKGYTGNVYLDAYELDGTLLWRIDLGVNIRAGAHYTQYMVYDFDGDGKSEVILKTAPGSKDGEGNYVSKAGKNITKGDDKKDYRNSSGLLMGKDGGPEYLTVFNGETGAAMQTVDFDPPRSILTSSEWGDSYANRSERYLAAVAYLDGVHPSVVMTRGYYTYVYAAAYTWDGTDLKEQWLSTNTPTEANGGTGCTVKYADGTSKNNTNKTLYAQGAHSVSVADVDNDGYDEIIFGSAVLDQDGTVLTYDG